MTIAGRRKTPSPSNPRRLWQSLARVLDHYQPDERQHFRAGSQAERKDHIYRDLRTLKQSVDRWLRNVQ